MSKRWIAAVVLILGVVLVQRSDLTYADLSLPGTGVDGQTYHVEAVFEEALNLARGAPVKVNGLVVGRVDGVVARDYQAVASLELREDAPVRAGVRARLRYDTPLGELFVELDSPASGSGLNPGAMIEVASTGTAATVEDTLSSASLLINGGSLGQLQTITRELNTALGGRESTARDALDRTVRILGEVNASRLQVDRLLRSLRAASAVLFERRATIGRAVREVAPLADTVAQNTDRLVDLLVKVDRLADSVDEVLGGSRTELLQLVREIGPVLDELIKTKDVMPAALRDMVRTAERLKQAIPGDFAAITADVPLAKFLDPYAGEGSDSGLPGTANWVTDLLTDLLGAGESR